MTAPGIAADRLLPADPATRGVARRLYETVRRAPIISPHGHVDAGVLVRDEPFADPAALFISTDHYVTRILHSHGVPLDALGVGDSPADPRSVWRLLCEHWPRFLGTTVRYWLECELGEVFGVHETFDASSSDRVYDRVAELLADPAYRPRALFERFGIEVLATTDDPADDLAAHHQLAQDPTWRGRVLPTFRADRYMDPAAPGWRAAVNELARRADVDCSTYAGLLDALRARRAAFAAAGGTATDSGVVDAGCEPLPAHEAERIHRAGLEGTVTAAEGAAARRNLLYRLAEMSCEDGLVMQLHAGVLRNTHRPTFARFGPDTGHDLPDATSFTRALSPVLQDFGTDPGLHLVLFTVDESTFSREIAPLAGFYPAVYAGAPWWFLDSPAAIERYRRTVTEGAGFFKTSGFVDDTRAFCSIPARHDMARRLDAGYLADLVVRHVLDEEAAAGVIARLVDDVPRQTFRLGGARGR